MNPIYNLQKLQGVILSEISVKYIYIIYSTRMEL
jgi:hypothetical protein